MISGIWMGYLKFSLGAALLVLGGLETRAQEAAEFQTAPPTEIAPQAEEQPSAPAAPVNGVFRLQNGDTIAGSLIAISPDDGIRWQHPDGAKPIDFRFDSGLEIELAHVTDTSLRRQSNCFLRLNSGDELEGRVEAADAESLTLATWYGNSIQIPRSNLQWLVFDDEETEYLFNGIESIEDWTIGDVTTSTVPSGEWAYRNGAFYATKAASIARKIDLPDRSQIEFDIHWKGTLNLAIALYTDYLQPVSLAYKDTEPDFGGFYSLQINSYFANVLMVKQSIPLQYLGRVQMNAFQKKHQAHVDIRVDKASNSIALLVDGQLVKQWIDPRGFAGEGSGIRLVHQGQGAIRFSNLQISEWDGQFDEPPAARTDSTDDLLSLRNGDKLLGKLIAIEPKQVEFVLANKSLKIPTKQVKKIEFGGIVNLPKLQDDSIRLVFGLRGMADLTLDRVENNQVFGRSKVFGDVTLRLDALSRIIFAGSRSN